eukprot:318464_1
MADVLQSISSESDDNKLCELYPKLFKQLQTIQSTLQEDEFMKNNIDELLKILVRDTNITTNTTITSNTLYHIMPIIPFILNSQYIDESSISYKLYFNILNILRDTQ